MPKLTMAERFARMAEDRTVREPKWGSERRRRIALAMIQDQHRKHDVINFTRKHKRARDLTHFLDSIATEADVQHVEQLLGIN
jgi:hypothetical protein